MITWYLELYYDLWFLTDNSSVHLLVSRVSEKVCQARGHIRLMAVTGSWMLMSEVGRHLTKYIMK